MPAKKRKPCKPTQIRNPKTGRCVLRAGKIGRKILGHAKPKAKSAKKPCRPDQIRNPASGRCVKRSGAIGRKILGRKPASLASKVNTQLKLKARIERYLDAKDEARYDKIWENQPMSTFLKMKQVCSLYVKKSGRIQVVEPQAYDRVSTLTPKNYMFKFEDYVSTAAEKRCGLFHSGRSGIAQSGDGGDFGDPWWAVNHSLLRWLKKCNKRAAKITGAS